MCQGVPNRAEIETSGLKFRAMSIGSVVNDQVIVVKPRCSVES